MRRLLFLLVVGVCLAGCGGSNAVDISSGTADDADAAGTAAQSQPAATSSDGTTASAAPAPFGTVALVDGGTLDGADLAGDNLALWFWAPW